MKILVLLNFTSKSVTSRTGQDFSKATVLAGNYEQPSIDGSLKPYEAVVYNLE